MLSHVQLFCDPMEPTRLLLSMEFSRQEYLSGLPFPPSGDLPTQRLNPYLLQSPATAGGFFTTEPPGKPLVKQIYWGKKKKNLHKMKTVLKNSKCNLIFFREKAYKIVPQQCSWWAASKFYRNNFWLLWKHVSPGTLLEEWRKTAVGHTSCTHTFTPNHPTYCLKTVWVRARA